MGKREYYKIGNSGKEGGGGVGCCNLWNPGRAQIKHMFGKFK